MKLVVDTNVIVSGILWTGAPHRLLALAWSSDLVIVSSPELLAELGEVLSRSEFALRLGRAGREPEAVLRDFAALCEIVRSAALPEPVCRDPDDDHVLACALASKADLVVSGDEDLLSLVSYRDIPIVDAAEALRRSERVG